MQMSTDVIQDIKTHIREHVTYPVSRSEMLAACNQMMDIPEAEREWMSENLPEGSYNSPEEVINALNL